MKIFAVDDEALALKVLCNSIKDAVPDAELKDFSSPVEMLDYAKSNECDVAFLDISMRGMTGIELAKELIKINSRLNIIFVTAYRDYYEEAWDIMASGYVTKPVTPEKIRNQLEKLRYSVSRTEKRIKVQAFGNFTVFADGKPIRFHRAKSKELLAYLIDRHGATVTRKEAASVLFESGYYEHNEQSYMNVIVKSLIKDLKEVNAQDIISELGSNTICANPNCFDCDSYDFLNGKDKSAFHGEYMTQYSWSELSIEQFL